MSSTGWSCQSQGGLWWGEDWTPKPQRGTFGWKSPRNLKPHCGKLDNGHQTYQVLTLELINITLFGTGSLQL